MGQPPKVDVGQIAWSTRRIQVAANILDDIDHDQIFLGDEELHREVVRKALAAFIKEHAAAVLSLSEVTTKEGA